MKFVFGMTLKRPRRPRKNLQLGKETARNFKVLEAEVLIEELASSGRVCRNAEAERDELQEKINLNSSKRSKTTLKDRRRKETMKT